LNRINKTTHKKWADLVRSIIPLGEDDPNHWWIYSFLINNRLQKK